MMMAHVMAVMLFLLIFLYNPKATDSLVEAENMKHKLLVCNDDAGTSTYLKQLYCIVFCIISIDLDQPFDIAQ